MKIIVAILLTLTLAAATFATFYFLDENNRNDNLEVLGSSVPANSPPNQSPQSQQPTATQSRLQVDGVNNPQAAANTLPEPKDFIVYEEHKNAESSLYIDVKEGTGREVVTGDKIAVLYSGYLTNGQLFDESRPNENNEVQPYVFTVGSGQVIPGWDQAIVGMKTGGQRRLIIPSAFGYGPSGQDPIPPNAMLIFDVQLAGIEGEQ